MSQKSLVDDPLPLKFALKVTHPLSKTTISTNIRSLRLNRESWRKKVQLTQTGSRPRAFHRAINDRVRYPYFP